MNTIKIACLIILITCLAPLTAIARHAPKSEPDFTAIDSYIEQRMEDIRIPGIALGIVQGDKIVYLQGYGIAGPSGRAVTPQTPFHLASLGKSFTALAIMQLVEAGHVELESPVQRYLPWFRVADAESSRRITVRHLLNQTSGLSNASDWDVVSKEYTGPDAIEQAVRALATVELNRPVGESFEYANMNYVILGMIVQTVSGQTYAEYIQQHIFSPLEMKTAYLDSSEDHERNAAVGHAYWFGFPRPAPLLQVPGHQPAGADSFSASVEAMSHYLIAHLNGGRYGEENLLSPAGIRILHQPAAPTGAPDTFYAMGWEKSVINGVSVVQHNGALPGFYAQMILVPADAWGVIMLTNADAALFGERTFAIAAGILDLLYAQQPAPPPANSRWQLYAILSLVEVIQIAGMIRFISLTRRWPLEPERRPASRGALLWHIGMPLVINFGWGFFILIVLPRLLNMPLELLYAFLPDGTAVLSFSAVMALGWSFLRTVLAFNTLRETGMPKRQSQQQFAER